MTFIFYTCREYPRMHVGSYLVILAQICGKPNFLEFWVKMGKITWKVQANDLQFSIPAESIPGCMFGANLVILA